MIVVGFIMAVASGVALPGHMLLFGRVINNFVYYSIASNVFSNPNFTMQLDLFTTSLNTSCSELVETSPDIFLEAIMSSSGNMTSPILCDDESEDIFGDVLNYVCDPRATLVSEIGLFSIYYATLASGVLVAIFFATLFWNLSAYRQSRRMRQAFYHSILHQEIGWFDVNEANELGTRLAE